MEALDFLGHNHVLSFFFSNNFQENIPLAFFGFSILFFLQSFFGLRAFLIEIRYVILKKKQEIVIFPVYRLFFIHVTLDWWYSLGFCLGNQIVVWKLISLCIFWLPVSGKRFYFINSIALPFRFGNIELGLVRTLIIDSSLGFFVPGLFFLNEFWIRFDVGGFFLTSWLVCLAIFLFDLILYIFQIVLVHVGK